MNDRTLPFQVGVLFFFEEVQKYSPHKLTLGGDTDIM